MEDMIREFESQEESRVIIVGAAVDEQARMNKQIKEKGISKAVYISPTRATREKKMLSPN